MNDFIIRKFEGHECAQTFVWDYSDGHRTLVSYNTIVAECTPDGWFRVFGLYSATTRKHIGWFAKECGITYQTAKFIFDEHLALNIFTGEVRELYSKEGVKYGH